MNTSLRNYLALNAVLNKRSFMIAFDDDYDLAAKHLGAPVENVKAFDDNLLELNQKGPRFDLDNPVVAALVNFFRNEEYAFLNPPNVQPIPLKNIVGSERAGQVSFELRSAVLAQIVRRAYVVDKPGDIKFEDGILYVPDHYNADDVNDAICCAYKLVALGPIGEQKGIPELDKRVYTLPLDGYRDISTKALVSILTSFIKLKVPPTVYRETMLMVPDLVPVFKETGAIMALSSTSTNAINWLMDVKDSTKGKVMTVSSSTIASLVAGHSKNFGNYEYDSTKKSKDEFSGIVLKVS